MCQLGITPGMNPWCSLVQEGEKQADEAGTDKRLPPAV